MSSHITEDQVRMVYRAVLNREPENDRVVSLWVGKSLELMIKEAIKSKEFSQKYRVNPAHLAPDQHHEIRSAMEFLCPRDLQTHEKMAPRVLLIGSCMLDTWGSAVEEMGFDALTDRLHIDMHPSIEPPHAWEEYRYQIGQVPLRSIFPDEYYLRWIRFGFSDLALCASIFEAARSTMEAMTKRCCCWSDKAPIFILNFLSPMQSVNGRLFRKFDLRDNRFFIRELNRELERIVHEIPNAYILDADECAANTGRRFFQEDSVWIYTHGGVINDSDWSLDAERIVKSPPLSKLQKTEVQEFVTAIFSESDLAYRSLRNIGAVKMVCVDLDDTLWRGVLAECECIDPEDARGGWPLGILEALAILKRRGILLCILSKNDEQTVRNIWSQLYETRFPLEEFAIKKINWNSKTDNFREALAEANVLPNSVVFLDDNPMERHTIASAFPDVRVVQGSHYYWKRILTWSAETQGAVITQESVKRTELVKAQIGREAARSAVSRDEFLRDLDLRVSFTKVENRNDPRFPRVVELVNKTNQFNTTGRRWTSEEIEDICQRGGIVLTANVSDRFSCYGLVVVALFLEGILEQIVMSCRVIGMEIELATLSVITEMALQGVPVVRARAVDTKSNLLSRDLFQRGGWFRSDDGVWQTSSFNPNPPHIKVVNPSATDVNADLVHSGD